MVGWVVTGNQENDLGIASSGMDYAAVVVAVVGKCDSWEMERHEEVAT